MGEAESKLDSLFTAIEKEAQIRLNKSSVPLQIQDEEGMFKGYYAFHQQGAIRVEVDGDEIVGIAVWNKPNSLNKPDYHCKLRDIDAFGEIDTIAKIIRRRHNFAGDRMFFESRLVEDATVDVNLFMNSIGGNAYDKKLSDLYDSYEQWAEVNSKKRLTKPYFFGLAKEWLIKNKKGKYEEFEITTGNKEETVITSSQEDIFMKEVIENEIYYKATLLEHAVKLIARDDPLINSLFICGVSGMGKTFTVKKILQDEGVWENKVVWKSGSIAGFTGLLQVLWENRKGRILVLDDCDNLLAKKEQSAINILKAALNTERSDRIISYVRMKRD